MAIAGDRWAWTPAELKAMSMEELLFNLAQIVLRIGEITDAGGVRSLRESSLLN